MKILFSILSIITFIKGSIAQLSFPSPFGVSTLQAGFVKNMGQVRDLENRPVDFVYYQTNIAGQQAYITKYGLSLLLARPKNITRIGASQYGTEPVNLSSADSLTLVTWELERIDIVLKNASILPGNIVSTANPQSPQFNFYLDATQTGEQHQYLQNEVLIKEVYPGIDWKVYIKEEKNKAAILKYDFIVHPGADPSQIQIRYSDNARIELLNNEIKANAKMGSIREVKPYSYLLEDMSEVAVAYSLKQNTIRFNTGEYNRSKTLVIDPSIFWLTYLSSTNKTVPYLSITGNDVETDAAGNIFVQLSAAGNTPFPTVNPGGGAYYQEYTASPDGAMIIIKFAPGGQMLWSTYFGNGMGGLVMTVDKFGNIIAMGQELNGTPSHPNPNPSIPLLNNGGYYDGVKKKFFISKFSNTGVLMWSSYFLNSSSLPTDMTYDINGNVYVVGWSNISNFPVVNPGGGAYVVTNPQYPAAEVLFISQFDPTNHLIWSTRIEGNNYDPYARVCTDNLGNIYIGGQARSNNYPVVNAGGYFDNSGWGSVITRFNPARQMTWSTYYPGPFRLADITTDDSSNLYMIIDRRIVKFNSNTQRVFEKTVNTPKGYYWNKINYDRYHDQIQILGVMSDSYMGFPTVNTACNGSFYYDGMPPRIFNNATGPIFATINHDGQFSYLSLVDWVYEYYDFNEMTIDVQGDPIYLFNDQRNGYVGPNPQLTNPGNGAYFDSLCCYNSGGTQSALLLKLTSSELNLNVQITPAGGCNCDGAATVTPLCGQAPFSYLWSNGATTASVTGLCPGNYWVKVTDVNNLSKTVYPVIPYPPGSITSVTKAIVPENCNRSNGKITITSVQGGASPYSYSLDGVIYNPSPQFTGLVSASYIVRIRDANGCVFNDTILLMGIPEPSDMTYTIKKSSCIADDGQIQVNSVLGGVGPYQYSLSGFPANSTGLFTNLAPATYQLTVTDTAGCTFSKTLVIEKAMAATDATYITGNDHCSQGIGFLQVSNVTGGTAPFTFSADSITFVTGVINNLTAASYYLYIKDAYGCVLKKGPALISNETGPAAINFTINEAYCGKLTGDIEINSVQGGSAPYNYSLDRSGYTPSGLFMGIQPGAHLVNVKDAFGCVHTETFEVDFVPIARIDLSPEDTTVCYNDMLSINLNVDLNEVRNINWSIPASGVSAIVKATNDQQIFVYITDKNNCLIRDTSIIKIKACNPPEKCMAVPTAFTPNNDGKNDKIGPVINGCRVNSIHFRIYNRWGELVFETYTEGKGWNGIYKGIPQPGDVYAFICNFITEDGINRQQKGTLVLIR